MHSLTYARIALGATLLIVVALSSGAIRNSSLAVSSTGLLDQTFVDAKTFDEAAELTTDAPDSLSSTSTYYRLRNDVRRCAFPRCGGYFVKSVNHALTRCHNGTSAPECYVAEINWNRQTEVESTMALVRGRLVRSSNQNFGALRVTESWRASTDQSATGKYYRVKDRGIRCITHPCLTHHAAMLNSRAQRNVAGVEFSGGGGSEESAATAASAMGQPDGVIVAGTFVSVTGPAGRAYSIRASQLYMRANQQASQTPAKPSGKSGCKRTGCSSQVCSDEDVMTTCEFRPEYACYRKARCERQADGKCGWTQTPELSACLRNPPPL